MRTRNWRPSKEDYDFIRENHNIMNTEEMGKHFGVHPWLVLKERLEMELELYEVGANTHGLELNRFLRRWERGNTWDTNPPLFKELTEFHKTFTDKKRIFPD